ncbi:hypothetical protein XELAEV_18011722mg [Xenopus laevis]|uniref:Uncharacterized protein n=1 Tax=Xenopus laevis TaxID=8355 RepID=A0A974DL97_XENLA|nr:hypothetical protein XELAEV_18011722mg [Xenopus laevis]
MFLTASLPPSPFFKGATHLGNRGEKRLKVERMEGGHRGKGRMKSCVQGPCNGDTDVANFMYIKTMININSHEAS